MLHFTVLNSLTVCYYVVSKIRNTKNENLGKKMILCLLQNRRRKEKKKLVVFFSTVYPISSLLPPPLHPPPWLYVHELRPCFLITDFTKCIPFQI